MQKKHILKDTLNRLLNHKWKLTIVIIITFASALAGTLNPLLVGRLIDEAIAGSNLNMLSILVLAIVILIITIELLNALRRYLVSKTVMMFINKLRIDVFKSLLGTNFSYFHKTKKGDLIQRSIDDTKSVQSFSVDTLPKFFYDLILATFSVIVVFSIYWPLGIVGIFVYFIYLIPVKHYGNRQREVSLKLTEHEADIKQKLLWKLQSISLIKMFGTEEREKKEYSILQQKWAYLTQRKYLEENKFRNFPRILDALSPGLVFGIGGIQVLRGNLSIGDLVAITRLLPAINAPISSFSSTFLAFKSIGVRLERVYDLLNLPMEPGKHKNLREVKQLKGNIQFNNVHYKVDQTNILGGVSFSIKQGEHVGIVGASGSGKSTVINLLTRMIEPTSGEILIDNVPINTIDVNSIRKQIGTLEQTTFIFNDTVSNNIKYLRPHSTSNVESIARIAGVDSFVTQLEHGYDTFLSENGKSLSGGQRQRIGIARVLFGNFNMMLFDEATSALDFTTEKKVFTGIRKVMKQKSCIFIAHRLETVENLDKILVMDNGKIVEVGTHQELIVAGGYYKKLWEARLTGKEEVQYI
jgi:ABC-type multidrug transport system fused ATPase/permease subunit